MKTNKKEWIDFSYYLYPTGVPKPLKMYPIKKEKKKIGVRSGQIKQYNSALGELPHMKHHKEP